MITWKIINVDVAPALNGLENVIVTVRWVCQAARDGKSGAHLGATALGLPKDSFVSYEDLTEEAVLNFCWSDGLDRQAVEAKATADLERALESNVVSPELPW